MDMNTGVPVIKTVDLKKYFKLKGGSLLHAVDGINLELYAGETLGIVGESGSGKSVTAYSIMQILADNGRITGGSVRGWRYTQEPPLISSQ